MGKCGLFIASMMIMHVSAAWSGQALTYAHIHTASKELHGQKIVAITFDDGPNPATTPGILKILDKYHVKATFFMLGQNVVRNPALVKDVARRGHEIGNHSFSHPNLAKLPAPSIASEIAKTQAALLKVGVRPQWFRPPYGAGLKKVSPIADASHLTCALWSVDTRDWMRHSPDAIDHAVMDTVKSGDVVLLHDTKKATLAALDGLLAHLRAKGYQFVTLSEWAKDVRDKQVGDEDAGALDNWDDSPLDQPLTVAQKGHVNPLG